MYNKQAFEPYMRSAKPLTLGNILLYTELQVEADASAERDWALKIIGYM